MPSSIADTDNLQTLIDFIRAPTPEAWLNSAVNNLPLLLLDHAHCERKAATTAINFISKYPGHQELVAKMSPLAREELLHFEKVIEIMTIRGFAFGPLLPSSYGQRLHELITSRNNKERLRDQLLIGAIIEARSCERFYALIPRLIEQNEQALARFYTSLVKSEARHFQDYLYLAQLYGDDIDARLDYFLRVENRLINEEDLVFRFHSGVVFIAEHDTAQANLRLECQETFTG